MKFVRASDLNEKQKKQLEEYRVEQENRIKALRETNKSQQQSNSGSGLLKRAKQYNDENKEEINLPTRTNNTYTGHFTSEEVNKSKNKPALTSQEAYILNARKERESYEKPVQDEINAEIKNYYNVRIGNKDSKTNVNKVSDTSELAHFQKKLAIQEMANDPKKYQQYKDYLDEQLNNFKKEDAIREGQKQAEATNQGMEEGKYISTISQYLGNQFGQGVEGFGAGLENALYMGFAGANKLIDKDSNVGDTFLTYAKRKNEIKQLRDYYSQDIDDKGLQFAGKVSNQIGNQVPSMALNVLAPGSGLYALGTSAGGRKAIETLNDDNSNYLQALATGTIVGGTEYLTERMFSGNALTRGLNATPLDEMASNAVSKVGNPFLRRLAGLGMDVAGENIEELVSNVVERGTDALINGKDFGSLNELLSEGGETLATTTATTMVLAMLGLGGETYNEANQIRANRDAYNQSVRNANLDANNQSIKSLFNSANSKELTPMFSSEIFENSNDSYRVVEMSDGSKILAINPDANITEVNEQIRKMSNKQLEQITTPMDEDIAEGIRRTAENNYLKEQQQESNRVALQESARQYGINPENETIKQIQSTLSDRGIRSYFDETFFDSPNEGAFYRLSRNEDGSYSREIVFNPNANENTIIQEMAVHELTHDIVASNTDVSQSMFQDVMNYLKQDTENFNTVRESVVNAYMNKYANSDVDVNSPDFQNMIDEELVAKTLQAKLGNQEFINKLHNENRTLFQKFVDWINNKVESFKNRNNAEYKFWKDIQNKFIEAYKNSEFKPGRTNAEINRYSDTVDISSDLSYNLQKNNNESEVEANVENQRRYDRGRITQLFKLLEGGQGTNEQNNNGLFKSQEATRGAGTTEAEVKLELMKYADTYAKKRLTKQEQQYKKIINNLGGDIIFYKLGENNLFPGLSDTSKIYIDANDSQDLTNIFHHEIVHFLRQNNNEIYMNEIMPIANEIAEDETFLGILSKYADAVGLDKVKSMTADQMAEEVIANISSSIYGDYNNFYDASPKIVQTIKNALDKVLDKNSQEGSSFNLQKNTRYSIDTATPTTDNQGRTLSKEQQEFYKDISEELKDSNGNIKTYYHGTRRGDRVGNIFDPNKATSGPMAFFTDNPEIAKNYSENKADTSLSREYDTEWDLFKADNRSLDSYWRSIPENKKEQIRQKGYEAGLDEDYNVAFGKNKSKEAFGDEYKYLLQRNNNNALKALYEIYVNSGNLWQEQISQFKDVLDYVGVDNTSYLDPFKTDSKVYNVYLNIKNPFNTSNISEDIINQLKEASKTAKIGEQYSADMWDKSSITPERWIQKLEWDLEEGTTHSWTVIPDWVTDVLKANGYDGIVDTGGKNGGVEHQVVIPFYSNQIKNVDNLNPTENPDIRYSVNKPQGFDEYIANRVGKEGTRTSYKDLGLPGARQILPTTNQQNPQKVEKALNELAQTTQPTQQTPILPPVNNNNIAETNEDGTGKKRRAYRSIIESDYMSDEAKAISSKLIGSDTYIPDSNKAQLQRADERIDRNGVTNELATLETNALEGKTIKADDIAVGDRLIQYYSMIGDEKNLERAVRATAMAGTQAGRAVQAFSMLKHQSPRRNGRMDSK